MIKKRIEALRKLMLERKISAYLVPTADFHESEYVGSYFKCREYITGFTGSAGMAVITQTDAGLWTDGRYFIQAARELEGSGVRLFQMGQDGFPTIEEYLYDQIPAEGKLAFDGRVVNAGLGNRLKNKLEEKKISICYEEDLIGQIWTDRPELSAEPAFLLDLNYSGEEADDKISKLRQAIREKGADVHILTSLPDINWLLNIRGNDIESCPVVLSYAIIREDSFSLFIKEEVLNTEVCAKLESSRITIKPYAKFYEAVKEIDPSSVVRLDCDHVNYASYHNLNSDILIKDHINPTVRPKAMKNPIEVENMRRAHIKDGVAVTKFMYWLKKNIGKIPMSEISTGDYIESLRKEQEGFIEPSFHTISAYKEHGAMCHYSATKESDKQLEPEGLLLVDSGGHYYEGTTDITRTFVLGEISEEIKKHFTLVAAGMLNLGYAKFLHGCRGINLDYIARGPIWEQGLDFNHGTGHGVGYLLSVHEPPNNIRWKMASEKMDNGILEEGMITSDEPGLYFEGSHGIRTENLVVCNKGVKNEYGQFMEFEFLTFAPIDLDGIDKSYLNEKEIERLNKYHKEVYDKISPYLTDEERIWLKTYTREIE